MGSTTDLALQDVFYAERRPDGSELLACGGKGQEIARQFMPTIAGVAERLEPCRLGAAVRMLRIEQVITNLFGYGGRLGCIWDWHRDGKRQNGLAQQRRGRWSVAPRAGYPPPPPAAAPGSASGDTGVRTRTVGAPSSSSARAAPTAAKWAVSRCAWSAARSRHCS